MLKNLQPPLLCYAHRGAHPVESTWGHRERGFISRCLFQPPGEEGCREAPGEVGVV